MPQMFRAVPGAVGIKKREMNDSLAILVRYFEILKYPKRSVGVVNLDVEIWRKFVNSCIAKLLNKQHFAIVVVGVDLACDFEVTSLVGSDSLWVSWVVDATD